MYMYIMINYELRSETEAPPHAVPRLGRPTGSPTVWAPARGYSY